LFNFWINIFDIENKRYQVSIYFTGYRPLFYNRPERTKSITNTELHKIIAHFIGTHMLLLSATMSGIATETVFSKHSIPPELFINLNEGAYLILRLVLHMSMRLTRFEIKVLKIFMEAVYVCLPSFWLKSSLYPFSLCRQVENLNTRNLTN
jgi:hypothetical protein